MKIEHIELSAEGYEIFHVAYEDIVLGEPSRMERGEIRRDLRAAGLWSAQVERPAGQPVKAVRY